MECGEPVTESRSVALEGARAVRATLELEQGELQIAGGGQHLLDAEFSYNVPAWEPELAYAVHEQIGRLTLHQPSNARPHGVANARNRWDLRFANDVPLDLGLKGGVVEGKLDLGALALQRLGLELGTGNLTLDLSGTRSRTLNVPIRAGVLNLKLIVPSDTGVQVEVRSPVLTMHAKGWQRARHIWVNDAYGSTPKPCGSPSTAASPQSPSPSKPRPRARSRSAHCCTESDSRAVG
ncbi:MAG: toast rack family protein [Chloroflexia bacterium]